MHPALLKGYLNTRYEAVRIRVRIGRRCPAMDRLLHQYHATEAVFITAHNPFSRRMPPGWNDRMNARLAEALRRYRVLDAKSHWNDWSELHFLVFSPLPPMRQLARRYRQNGVVIVRLRHRAQLILAPFHSMRHHTLNADLARTPDTARPPFAACLAKRFVDPGNVRLPIRSRYRNPRPISA